MNYLVGDFIIQLKNASMAHKKHIVSQYSNINKAIAKVLKKEGFLEQVSEDTVDGKRVLSVSVRFQRRKPAITDVKLISKPSLRTYVGASEIGRKQGRAAIAIISTNIGILTGKEAIKKGVGGELLFKIW
jgi:small subunit ribosomal protein S8